MAKATTFTIEIETKLLAEFVAAADAADRPTMDVVCQLIREWIDEQRERRQNAAFVPVASTTTSKPNSMPGSPEPTGA